MNSENIESYLQKIIYLLEKIDDKLNYIGPDGANKKVASVWDKLNTKK